MTSSKSPLTTSSKGIALGSIFHPKLSAIATILFVVTLLRIEGEVGTTSVGVSVGEDAFLIAKKFEVENSSM